MARGLGPPRTITYTYPSHDFGAGADAVSLKAPKGSGWGELQDIGVQVTETFTADTLAATVLVGTASDANYYAQLEMGLAADTNYWNTQDDPDAIINNKIDSTQVEVAFTAPTGGTPAGIGTVSITIAWYSGKP